MGTTVVGFDELTSLEAKVERVAGQIERLRSEKDQLNGEIQRMREELASRDLMEEQLRRDLELAKSERRDLAKEELIRGKLTTLLGKIEAMEAVAVE